MIRCSVTLYAVKRYVLAYVSEAGARTSAAAAAAAAAEDP